MCVTFYTAKCPEPLIYVRFRAFFVQSAKRGGRLLIEKQQFFDDCKKKPLPKERLDWRGLHRPPDGG